MKNAIISFSLIAGLLITFISCSNPSNRSRKPVSMITILPQAPYYPYGATVSVNVQTKLNDGKLETVELFHNGQLVTKSKELDFTVDQIHLNNTGNNIFTAKAVKTDDVSNSRTVICPVVSDQVPEKYSYSIIKDYPHDRRYYTQGLEYHSGYIFEGTGEYGSSGLFKVQLTTGKTVLKRRLPDNYFGEGITLFNDKIYQLTYRAQKGFIYHPENFALIDSFTYHSTEGWGLTNDGKYLIMSNGTHELIWLDPTDFSEVRRLSVVNDLGLVNFLNELEFINETIYANVYTTNLIVQIDPQTGKVISEINLEGILNMYRNPTDTIDYLNGIAYDHDRDRFFVTGKWWPRIFQIEMVKSK